jgi:hypothetical protein
MEMTLDDYLAEVDRWKERAAARNAARQRASEGGRTDDSIKWLEKKLGRNLERPTLERPANDVGIVEPSKIGDQVPISP